MARRETAARRYAEAAFQVASADGTLNRWQVDLGVLTDALAIPELRAVMEHPAIPYRDKERVLRRVVSEVAVDAGTASEAIVEDILSGGPIAVREAKKLVRERPRGTEVADTAAARRTSEEGQDGLRAFLERRSPGWIAGEP